MSQFLDFYLSISLLLYSGDPHKLRASSLDFLIKFHSIGNTYVTCLCCSCESNLFLQSLLWFCLPYTKLQQSQRTPLGLTVLKAGD